MHQSQGTISDTLFSVFLISRQCYVSILASENKTYRTVRHSRDLRDLHDMLTAGHLGRDRTRAAAHRVYYWPTMRVDIDRYVTQRKT